MSAVSKEKKFLFIHIPKTAGTSMESRDYFKPVITSHWGIADYMEQGYKLSDFDGYFKFAFVRNPYDRLASVMLNHTLKKEKHPEVSFNSGIIKYKDMLTKWIATKPQHTYIYLDGKLVVDFVGRYENLEEDWKKVCKKLGQDFDLPITRKGLFDSSKYKSLYSLQTKKIVQELYKEDFKLFGYER